MVVSIILVISLLFVSFSFHNNKFSPVAKATTYTVPQIPSTYTVQDSSLILTGNSLQQSDTSASDGSSVSLNADKDFTEIFSVSSYMTLSQNYSSVGIRNDSYQSIALNLAGWGSNYPTVTVNGDLSGKKSIRLWVLVKPNAYTNTNFTGPDIPISNMSSGNTLAIAQFEQWTQITIDFSAMGGGNSFGFLYDRAPLNVAGSLDLYFDQIEFLDNSNQPIAISSGDIGTGKNAIYKNWDFSWTLKYATAYDVIFRIKAEKSASATGNAFNCGVYDETQNKELIIPKTVTSSEIVNSQWVDVIAGTLKPNFGVNKLQFYIEALGNIDINDLKIDYIIFKEVTSSVIENTDFTLLSGATTITDGRAPDNSAVRITNGTQTTPAAEILIDGADFLAAEYSLSLTANPDRPAGANWDNSTGEITAVELQDITTGSYLMNKNSYLSTTSPFHMKVEYFAGIGLGILINPTHDYKLRIYPVNNSSNFPSVRYDSLTLTRVMPEDWYDSTITYEDVKPYKISPASIDGINDYCTITYSLRGIYEAGKTIDVTIYDENGTEVRKLVNDREDWMEAKEKWDGKNNSGITVPNGLYTVDVRRSDGVVFLRKNVQVQGGPFYQAATSNSAKNYFPKGVWFEGGNIPFEANAARSYLDICFNDIKNANCNTVYLSNWNSNPTVVSVTLEKAKQYGLYVIGYPGSGALFKNWGGSNWAAEGLYINDEYELNSQMTSLANLVLNDVNASQHIGFLLYDEPRYDYLYDIEEFSEHLSLMRRMLEAISPTRFTVIDYCMPEDASYFYHKNQTQALSIDLYPCSPAYSVGNFKHIGGYENADYERSFDVSTLQVREELTNEAPVWPIIQMQETTTVFRDPEATEIRAMVYESIGRGAKGMAYFMYQSTIGWRGMVDYDYTKRQDYYTVQQLNSEIEALKPTILDMRRIANVATTSGGGGGANVNPYDSGYASADITSHESVSTGNGYLVVVNHDCLNTQNVTINIDRAKLGYNISGIKLISKVNGSETNVAFTTTTSNYTISNMSFLAGDGVILKLIRNTSQIVKTIQDSSFAATNSEATRGNADISATDAKTAIKIGDDSNSQWDFYAYLSSAGLTAGISYDVYARVKIKYKTDIISNAADGPSFPLPAGNAFIVGCKTSGGTNLITASTKVASTLENMLWTNIKIGTKTFTSTQLTGTNAFVYLNPENNMANIETIYVDSFFFTRK